MGLSSHETDQQRQTDREVDRWMKTMGLPSHQTNRQTDGQTDGEVDTWMKTMGLSSHQTDRQRGRYMDEDDGITKPSDRQTER